MKKAIFLLYFFFSFYVVVMAQDKKAVIINIMDHFKTTVKSNPDSAFYYISKATRLSEELKDKEWLMKSYYNFGYYYLYQNDYKKAEYYIRKALLYAEKLKDYKVIAFVYNELGNIYYRKNQYIEALRLYHKALEVCRIHNQEEYTPGILISVADLYDTQGDKKSTFKTLKDVEVMAQKFNDMPNLSIAYNNLGNLYMKQKSDSAIYYYKKSMSLAKKLNDKFFELNATINIGVFYLNQNDNSKCFDYLNKSYQLASELKSKENLYYIYSYFGQYYNAIKQYSKAILFYKKALSLNQENLNIEQNIFIYKSIIEANQKIGNYEEAFSYQQKYNAVKDSVFTIEQNKVFNDIQTKYEVDKKNLKINLLTKEKQLEENRKKLVFYIGLILLIPLIILLLFYKHRIKTQKIIRDKENQIHQQEKLQLEQEQELRRIKALIEGQDKERNRIAKEIHDGVGGQLAGIKLSLSQINSEIKNDTINAVIDNLSNSFQELRAISHNLSLNYIRDKSMDVLLYDLQQEYQNRNEFSLEIIIFPEDSLLNIDEEIKHQLYRIIQELLANVSKHAKAKNVFVNITKHDSTLNIIVEDDGCGFSDIEETGIGVKNIKERLLTINGTMNIESRKGKGSTIVIDIPI